MKLFELICFHFVFPQGRVRDSCSQTDADMNCNTDNTEQYEGKEMANGLYHLTEMEGDCGAGSCQVLVCEDSAKT